MESMSELIRFETPIRHEPFKDLFPIANVVRHRKHEICGFDFRGRNL